MSGIANLYTSIGIERTRSSTRPKKIPTGGFEGVLDDEYSEDGRINSLHEASSLGFPMGLLLLQERGGEPPDAGVVQKGSMALDMLREIQIGLLQGCVDADRLAALTDLSRELDVQCDPSLREAMLAIELRAKVELAKLRRLKDPAQGLVSLGP